MKKYKKLLIFTDKTVTINPECQKIGVLNIFVLPGFIVDAIIGDMMKIPEAQRNIDMRLCEYQSYCHFYKLWLLIGRLHIAL